MQAPDPQRPNEEQPNANNNNEAQPAQQSARPKKDKPKKESWSLKPEHLEAKKGLQSLYEKTLALNLDEKTATLNVEATMKKIMVVLKTWHFEAAPKYNFEYFLQRLQALGSHPRVTVKVHLLRPT